VANTDVQMQALSSFSMASFPSRSSKCGILVKLVSLQLPDATPSCLENTYSLSLVPAVLIGVILGPVASRFLDAEKWGSAAEGQQEAITLVSTNSHNASIEPY
jgi:hypothetical protein